MEEAAQAGTLELAMLEALFAQVNTGVVMLDERLRVLRANSRVTQLGGGGPFEPGTLPAIVSPSLAGTIEQLARRALQTGAAVAESFTAKGPEQRRLELRCLPVEAEDMRGVLVQMDDVSERWLAEQRLKLNEALLAETQELSGLGSWEWDLRTQQVTWSAQCLRLLGLGQHQVPSGPDAYARFLPAQDRVWIDRLLRQAATTGEPFQFEHRLLGADGVERMLETRGRPERVDGRVVRITGTALDITERKRAEQRLREQQQFLDAIVENIPNMIFVKEAKELRYVRLNRAGEELLGYGREHVIGKSDHDVFPAAVANAYTRMDRAVLQTRQVRESFEETVPTRGRGVRTVRTKKVPILDESGQPAYLLGISEDVTERQRSEDFRLSDLLVRSMEDYAVFLLDADGRVKTWNAGAERVTGYSADEIIGKPIETLRDGTDGDSARSHLAAAAVQGRMIEEGPWRCKDGRQIWRVTTVTAIHDDEGKAILYGTVTRDVTERKRAEDERERLLKRLREALRLRDEFLSVASHELRTPVTTLMLQTELLRQLLGGSQEELLARLPQLVDRLKRQTDRLEEHVARLLDVSRLSSGRVQLQLTEHDLGPIAESVVARFLDEQRGRPVIHFRAAPDLYGRWDTLRIDQVLTNLLSNAVKYGNGLPVTVELADEGDAASLRVTDRGIGIAAADHARIFNQFERAVSERHYGGLGLGLFIVRQLVEAMGGRVSVQSEPGAGASFVVRLPYGRIGDDPSHR